MALNHGVNTYKSETNFAAVKEAAVGIPFFVGAWPCHTTEKGFVDKPQLVTSYDEAVSLGGYSSEWRDSDGNPKWSLCQAIYSQFKLFCMTPAVVFNVYNPKQHKKAVEATTFTVADHIVKLPYDVIKDESLVVKDDLETLVLDTDYEVYYNGENCIIELLPDSTFYNATVLNIGYNVADLSTITTATIEFAIEKIEMCMGLFGIVPDLICCPGWSQNPSVAAVMAAKAPVINGLFKGKAVVDIDSSADGVSEYSEVLSWKNKNGYTSEDEIVCWPLVKVGDYLFDLSVITCGLIAKVDEGNGDCPYESPSNKSLTITAAVNKAGEEISLNLQQADTISVSAGVVTVLNFNGWVLWGNYTGCWPASSDVSRYFTCCNRTMDWICNTFVLTYWSYVDKPLTRVLIDAICNSFNSWLNGLTHENKLYGGEISYIADLNPVTNLIGGKFRLDTKMASPVPAQEINMYCEYDVSILENALNS